MSALLLQNIRQVIDHYLAFNRLSSVCFFFNLFKFYFKESEMPLDDLIALYYNKQESDSTEYNSNEENQVLLV